MPEGIVEIPVTVPVSARVDKLLEVIRLPNNIEKNRIRQAQANQQLALELYQLLASPKNPKAQETMELMARLKEMKSEAVNNVINGARAQAGVMHALKTHGFWVFNPTEREAVRVMDLDDIDLAVIDMREGGRRGNLYFIDVKSGESTKAEQVDRGRVASAIRLVVKAMEVGRHRSSEKEEEPRWNAKCACLKLFVPTGGSFMDRYGKMREDVRKSVVELLSRVKTERWL